jgi:hypothetical protein
VNWPYDLQTLLDEAMAVTGLSDFGEPDLSVALSLLLESYREDVPFSEFGRQSFHSRIHLHLCNRLRITADRQRYPGIAHERIERPLFITGLPRSGTSFLLDVLARDPRNRVARTWEIYFSSPPPEAASYASDPRIEQMRLKLEELGYNDPDVMATHPWGEELPEECSFIVEQSFVSENLGTTVPATRYASWLATKADHGLAFRYHRRLLQNLQYRHRGERWALKAPSHMFHLRALLDEYPDALVVVTHRDPARVLPSVASMARAFHKVYLEKSGVDSGLIGQSVTNLLANGVRHAMDVRDRIDRPGQFCDVLYDDLRRDPIGTVERIYSRFGISLPADSRAAMTRFVAEGNAKHGGRSHRYALADYGFSEESIESAFRFYTDRYRIPRGA